MPYLKKEKLPTTIFEKLNVFTENEDIKCKYYTKDQFKELVFDKDSKQMSLMHLSISLSYHIDELTNLLNELNTNFKVIGITKSRLTTKKDEMNSIERLIIILSTLLQNLTKVELFYFRTEMT